MRSRTRKRLNEWLISLPSLAWLTVFFVVPTAMVFAIAFRPADPFGGIGEGWTLATLGDLASPSLPRIVLRTLWISVLCTLFCLALALPTAYCMARAARRWRQILMVLVIVPFWTNFLTRIFAWKVVLLPNGGVKQILVLLHLSAPGTPLMYNPAAVVLVTVYTYLPFAILPIYAAAEKFDFSLIEAARDLGAGRMEAFTRVFLPGVRRALLTATLVVFIPALGSYIIPQIVGGAGNELLGNRIAQRTLVDRNLPQASALSALLATAVLLPMGIALTVQLRRRAAGPGGLGA